MPGVVWDPPTVQIPFCSPSPKTSRPGSPRTPARRHDEGDHLLGFKDGVFTYLSVPRLDSQSAEQGGKKLCFVDHKVEPWDLEKCCFREAVHVHAHIHDGDKTEDILLEQCMEEAGCTLPMLRDMANMRAPIFTGDEYDLDHEHQEGCGHSKIKHGDHFDWLIPLEDGSYVLSHVQATANGRSQFIEHGRLVKVGESLGQLKRRRGIGGKELVGLFTYEPRRRGYEILPATEDDLPGMIDPDIVTVIKSPSHGCVSLSTPSQDVVLSIPRSFKSQDLTRTTFDVMGICCPSEVPIVKKILEPLSGVEEVLVNPTSKTVTVQHDPKVVTDVQLVKVLNEARLDASIHQRGKRRMAHKWPSPWTIGSGVLLIIALLHYVWDPLKWVALGSVAVGVPPILIRSMVALKQCVLDINALMIIAVGGAIALGDYVEAGSIVFLFTLAEWLESRSSDQTRQAISNVAELAPQTAVLMDGQRVNVDDVSVGTILAVKTGELIPIDGEVVSGKSSIDESNVTGESMPVEKTVGAIVWAGTMNLSGYISVKTTALAEDSAVSRMVRLVEEAQNQHSPTEQLVSKLAKYYTPLVVVTALGIAVIPWAAGSHRHRHWIYLALVLLVVACPCALVISTPVATTCGIAQAARSGLLVRGGNYLEALAKVKILAMDKTGTLTEGHFRVLDVQSVDSRTTVREVLHWIASVENKSSHPLAPALVAYARLQEVEPVDDVADFEIIPGLGVAAAVDGQNVQIGNARLASSFIGFEDGSPAVIETWNSQGATVGWVGVNGRVVGVFGVADSVRVEASETVAQLKNLRVRIVMLTGDSTVAASAAQSQVGDIEVHAELLPEQKVALVRELKESGTTAMVGDGVNDAPALALADVGIAMGVAGSAVAMETADVALMTNDLRKIAVAIALGQDVRRKIIQNVALSFVTKIAIIILAAAGKPSLWAAVLADVGTCLAVIFNSMRLLHRKKGIVLPKFESKKSRDRSRHHRQEYDVHDQCLGHDHHLETGVGGSTIDKLHQELGKIENGYQVYHEDHLHPQKELEKIGHPMCHGGLAGNLQDHNHHHKHEHGAEISSESRNKSGHSRENCRDVNFILDQVAVPVHSQTIECGCKVRKCISRANVGNAFSGPQGCCVDTEVMGTKKCCSSLGREIDDRSKKKDVSHKICSSKFAEECCVPSTVSARASCCKVGSGSTLKLPSSQELVSSTDATNHAGHSLLKTNNATCANSKSDKSRCCVRQGEETHSNRYPSSGKANCCTGVNQQRKCGLAPADRSRCCRGQGDGTGLNKSVGSSFEKGGCCERKDPERKCRPVSQGEDNTTSNQVRIDTKILDHTVQHRPQIRHETQEQISAICNSTRGNSDDGSDCHEHCCKKDTKKNDSSGNDRVKAQIASRARESAGSGRFGSPCCSPVECSDDGSLLAKTCGANADGCCNEVKACGKTAATQSSSACELGRCQSADHSKCGKEALAHSPLRDLTSFTRPIAPL